MITDTLPNLNSQDIIARNVVNNLETKSVHNLNNVLPNLDYIVVKSLNQADACVQTDLLNKAEVFVQTDVEILIAKIQEVLYGMCSEGDNLSNIDLVTFTNEIRDNPQYSGWFNSIQNWAKDIKAP